MISDYTHQELDKAISNACKYTNGTQRKTLQVAYDKMISELSDHYFNKACSSRMEFRQNMNGMDTSVYESDQVAVIDAIKNMLKNENLLFNRDYREISNDVKSFLTNHLYHFLSAISNA